MVWHDGKWRINEPECCGVHGNFYVPIHLLHPVDLDLTLTLSICKVNRHDSDGHMLVWLHVYVFSKTHSSIIMWKCWKCRSVSVTVSCLAGMETNQFQVNFKGRNGQKKTGPRKYCFHLNTALSQVTQLNLVCETQTMELWHTASCTKVREMGVKVSGGAVS